MSNNEQTTSINPQASIDNISSALGCLQSKQEVIAFLHDFLSPKEIQTLDLRLHVAYLIQQGYSYRQISKQTGVSTATITRVARSFARGHGGYQMVLQRREELL